jgi:hypothetical protein
MGLSSNVRVLQDEAMSDEKPVKPQGSATREERLAAKLRENLRRRKEQARAMDATLPKQPSKG